MNLNINNSLQQEWVLAVAALAANYTSVSTLAQSIAPLASCYK